MGSIELVNAGPEIKGTTLSGLRLNRKYLSNVATDLSKKGV